ncbi:MAG: hypothetical protein ACP5G1_03185 [Nanopusillaceae archaeon]
MTISVETILLTTLVPLLIYSLVLYISENILLKYIEKYSKYYSNWKEHYLLLYTVGLASALQSFLPSLLLTINGNSKLGYYLQLYNVLLDFTVTLGIFILIFDFEKNIIDRNLLFLITIAFLSHLIFIVIGKIGFVEGSILYAIFLIISVYLLLKYREDRIFIRKSKNKLKEYIKAILYSFEIAFAASIIYLGGNIINNVANTLLKLNLSIPLIAFAISIILFTLPDILYGHISWVKKRDINISLSSIFGEELAIFTIFTGIIGMANPIIFGVEDIFPITLSMLTILLSITVLYILSYKRKMPKLAGLILIIIGISIGFLNNMVGT